MNSLYIMPFLAMIDIVVFSYLYVISNDMYFVLCIGLGIIVLPWSILNILQEKNKTEARR